MKKLSLIALVVLLVAGFAQPIQAQDQIEITFVHVFSDAQDFRAEVVQQIADAYMADHPNVTVTIQSTASSYEELFNNALLGAEQGNAPHVVQVDESLTQLAVDSGYFISISDAANAEQLAETEDYLPQVLDFFTVDGKLWSLPWNTSNPILYYNVDMFAAAGIEAPPTTFEEMLATCEVLMAAEIEGLTACANWPLVSWFVEQWLAMQGAELLDNDNGRTGRAGEIFLESPEVKTIVEWWQEMEANGYYTYTGRTNDYNGEAIIFLGKSTAMHINSTAGLALLQSFSEAQGFQLGVAPLPRPHADATQGVTVGGASVFISAGHPDAETQAAIDFAFFLTNTQNGATWHKGTGYFPNRQSTVDLLNAENWFEENPFFAIGLNQLLDSERTPATAGMVLGPAAEARGIVQDTIKAILDNDEDVDESLAAAKARIDAVLADYNALFE